ncbi:MAG: AraC family transcriptional regulator [Treponemataceae bacterium]
MEKNRLTELLEKLTTAEGKSKSVLPGLELYRVTGAVERHPVAYEPSVVIVAQGRKIGYLGDKTYVYDAQNYLVLSAPLPFECEVVADSVEPYLAMSVRIDPAVLADMLSSMDEPPAPVNPLPRCICATPLTEELTDAAVRLLRCLQSPTDAGILGPAVMREIVYRVLCGPKGHVLRALAVRDGRFGRIARVLNRIHTDYDRGLDVEALAEEAGMSVSAFHHTFKTVTATSPVQYLKSIRLHKARLLMIQDGLNAGQAAGRVGYESASQFSREYKRFFGAGPRSETAAARGSA